MPVIGTHRRRRVERPLRPLSPVTRFCGGTATPGVTGPLQNPGFARGGVEHVEYGLYRFDGIPRNGKEELIEAVLRVGDDAFLTHDSVLAPHDLAMVNPRRIRVGTSHRVRPQVPASIEVIRQHLRPDELTFYEGIASATVTRALEDCQPRVMNERRGPRTGATVRHSR